MIMMMGESWKKIVPKNGTLITQNLAENFQVSWTTQSVGLYVLGYLLPRKSLTTGPSIFVTYASIPEGVAGDWQQTALQFDLAPSLIFCAALLYWFLNHQTTDCYLAEVGGADNVAGRALWARITSLPFLPRDITTPTPKVSRYS